VYYLDTDLLTTGFINMNLVKNVGSTDKTIRLIAGFVLLALGVFGLGGAGGILVSVVGVVLIATGALNFCPLFKLINFSSIKN